MSQRHPRHAEIHKAHEAVDPVRRNSPQSDQTGESFLLTGRVRNYSCEVCEFRVSAGETSDSFYLFFLRREVQFSLYQDFTTIRLRGFHPGRRTWNPSKHVLWKGDGVGWNQLCACARLENVGKSLPCWCVSYLVQLNAWRNHVPNLCQTANNLDMRNLVALHMPRDSVVGVCTPNKQRSLPII